MDFLKWVLLVIFWVFFLGWVFYANPTLIAVKDLTGTGVNRGYSIKGRSHEIMLTVPLMSEIKMKSFPERFLQKCVFVKCLFVKEFTLNIN